jgi:hypothetical protein
MDKVNVDCWTNRLGHYCWSVYRNDGGWDNFIACGTTNSPHVEGRHRSKPEAPRHCGNRSLDGDHHAVCDCPDSVFDGTAESACAAADNGLLPSIMKEATNA